MRSASDQSVLALVSGNDIRITLKYVITYHNVVDLNLQVVYLFYNPSTFIRKEGYIEDSSQYAGFIRIEQSAKCVVSIYVDVVVEQRKIRDMGVVLLL